MDIWQISFDTQAFGRFILKPFGALRSSFSGGEPPSDICPPYVVSMLLLEAFPNPSFPHLISHTGMIPRILEAPCLFRRTCCLVARFPSFCVSSLIQNSTQSNTALLELLRAAELLCKTHGTVREQGF